MLGPTSSWSVVRVTCPQIDAYRLVGFRSVSPYSLSRSLFSSSEHHRLGGPTGPSEAARAAQLDHKPSLDPLASCVLSLRCRRHGTATTHYIVYIASPARQQPQTALRAHVLKAPIECSSTSQPLPHSPRSSSGSHALFGHTTCFSAWRAGWTRGYNVVGFRA